jgi:hypothetical protein
MNMEGQPVEGAAVDTPELNLFQRVMLTFTAPSKLGEYVRSRQPWFWTLAIVAIVSAVLFLVMPAELIQSAMERGAQGRSEGQEMDPDTMLLMGRVSTTVGALLMTFVFAFAIAGVVYLTFNVMLGGDSTYKQHLSAVSHMYWINLLAFLIVLPLWISKGDMNVRLSLGLLLADEPSSIPTHFMNSIGLFGLWASAVLGTIESGLSGGKISVGKGITTVLVLYFMMAIGSAVIANAFA